MCFGGGSEGDWRRIGLALIARRARISMLWCCVFTRWPAKTQYDKAWRRRVHGRWKYTGATTLAPLLGSLFGVFFFPLQNNAGRRVFCREWLFNANEFRAGVRR
jgi:hypothetical protein